MTQCGGNKPNGAPCKDPVEGSAHKCDACGCLMHAFCGRPLLDENGDEIEGHGAPRRCAACDADEYKDGDGVALHKLDRGLRRIMEGSTYSLTHSSHLRKLIPFVAEQELEDIKQEVQGRMVAVIFDGTTKLLAEVLAVVLR